MNPIKHTTAQLATITPSLGEVLIDTDKGCLIIGDGTTKGGIPLGTESTHFKSYNFAARTAATGAFYLGGFYYAPAADADLANDNLTVALGTANHSAAAHAFIVAEGVGVTDGTTLVLTVSGTSITDAGVRTATDTEIICADLTALATDDYLETVKKWIGEVTWTLSSAGGTTFTFVCNYGLCKYDTFGGKDFTLTDFDFTGLCNANDTGIDIEVIHHKATGWTYHASAFDPTPDSIAKMTTVHSTESDVTAAEHFSFKRTGLTEAITGSGVEGFLIRVTQGVNNSISYLNGHVGVTIVKQ